MPARMRHVRAIAVVMGCASLALAVSVPAQAASHGQGIERAVHLGLRERADGRRRFARRPSRGGRRRRGGRSSPRGDFAVHYTRR